jgi:ATP-dependent DNA helicase UvrD/PcrA
MVDEYQDTNYVQEQILLQLARPSNNICVVGDEDQSLYRFRGATPRNILEFHMHFQSCHEIVLDINYRSHPHIINAYNGLIESIDWSNPNGLHNFRFNKNVKADPSIYFPDYPALFSISALTIEEEGTKFAQLIKYLKENNIIEDYSDVALLLHSVRPNNSVHYMEALRNHGIPYFAPRAKRFFENEEVRLMIACYAFLLNFYGSDQSTGLALSPTSLMFACFLFE